MTEKLASGSSWLIRISSKILGGIITGYLREWGGSLKLPLDIFATVCGENRLENTADTVRDSEVGSVKGMCSCDIH